MTPNIGELSVAGFASRAVVLSFVAGDQDKTAEADVLIMKALAHTWIVCSRRRQAHVAAKFVTRVFARITEPALINHATLDGRSERPSLGRARR